MHCTKCSYQIKSYMGIGACGCQCSMVRKPNEVSPEQGKEWGENSNSSPGFFVVNDYKILD